MVDLAVVGHFSLDSLKLPSNQVASTELGGAVAYVSLVARRLGASVSVISKVGGDFPESYLSRLAKEGIDISGVVKTKEEKTTRFELIYNSDFSSRDLKLRSRASSITITDLPLSLRSNSVHIAPIAAEIDFEVVEQLREHSEILSIDPQGITRRFDGHGNVTLEAKMDPRLLGLTNIFKSSSDEIVALTGEYDLKVAMNAVNNLGPEIVIVTLGSKGSLLLFDDVVYDIPVYRSAKVVDPTGAGDGFIGAFMIEYLREKDCLWSACVGSAAASLVVESMGTLFFWKADEIYRRADFLYEKRIKQ
jgi:sugar/nucleoside kinase (ribokinase family)